MSTPTDHTSLHLNCHGVILQSMPGGKRPNAGRHGFLTDPVRLELTVERTDLPRIKRIASALRTKGTSQTFRRLLDVLDHGDTIEKLSEYAPHFTRK